MPQVEQREVLLSWLCRKPAASAPRARDHAQVELSAPRACGERWSGSSLAWQLDYHQPMPWTKSSRAVHRAETELTARGRWCAALLLTCWRWPPAWLRRRWWLQRPLPLAAPSVELSIAPGTPPREVAARLGRRPGVQTVARLLYEWFRWSGEARRIRAGSYEIGRGTTPRQLLDKMVRGDEVHGDRAPDRRLDLPAVPRRAGQGRGAESRHRRA